MDRDSYTVRIKRSDDWWAASIDEMPGALTQGKTLASTLSNMADAVRMLIACEAEDRETTDRAGAGGKHHLADAIAQRMERQRIQWDRK